MLLATESYGEFETGGMLVGYESPEDAHAVVVTGLIEGGPNARQGQNFFHPDGRWQRTELARVYERSGRVETFLGDWHSHPHGLPLPSPTDLRTAARTAANKRARAPRPLTLIVGRHADENWVLAAFRFERGKLIGARLRAFDAAEDELVDALDPSQRLGRDAGRDSLAGHITSTPQTTSHASRRSLLPPPQT